MDDDSARPIATEPPAGFSVGDVVPPPPEAATGTEAVSTSTPAKSAFPAPSAKPTQFGPKGIRYDFNNGARISLPVRSEGDWRVQISDLDTGNILFVSKNKGAFVSSAKRYFVRFRLEIWEQNEGEAEELVLRHDYSAREREVLIQFPIGTLGDILAWFPYAPRFAEAHGCKLTCAMSPLISALLAPAYPEINFVSHDVLLERELAESAYASYSLGLFFDDDKNVHQPTDFRHVGLHRTAGYILGVDPTEQAPKLVLEDETRPIAGPYVVIAVQSSTQCKYWNNPHGWRDVVAFVKSMGYRVICIDQKPVHGTGLIWNHIPNGAEDETGDRPLAERARWLRHAEAFIGLSSGLAWLAWAAGTNVVMISGFTHPTNEFDTPYRVINWHACNSCWNDVRHRFDHNNFMWCPRHADTPRQFECTRLITSAQVIQIIERIPDFARYAEATA